MRRAPTAAGDRASDAATSDASPSAKWTMPNGQLAATPTLDPSPDLLPFTLPAELPAAQPNNGVLVKFNCDDTRYWSMEDAWKGEYYSCLYTKAKGKPSRKEAEALRVAYGPKTKVSARKVKFLYGICASSNRWWPGNRKNDTDSAEAGAGSGPVVS